TIQLKKYPQLGFFRRYAWYRFARGIKIVRILDYIPYVKDDVVKLLVRELDWHNYGAKHHESLFTRFYQTYYLPQKFGFDKRRAHLSGLIWSGQKTREQALREMMIPQCTPDELNQMREYVAKKLGWSLEEFDRVMASPVRSHRAYPVSDWLYQMKGRIT